MNLRDYQQKSINDIRDQFNAGRRKICFVAPCGSGKTVIYAYMASEAASRGYKSLFVVHRRELLSQAAKTIIEHKNINIGMAQTLSRQINSIDQPDIIIIDEAHHATARTWRNLIDAFPNAYIVGLTATPARLGGQGLGDIFDSLVIGPTAKELIQAGHLAPYKYYAPPIVADFKNVKIKLGDYDQKEISIIMDKPAIIGDAIQHYQRLANGKRAIVYCASREHSRNVVDAFRAVGINALHIDGETPSSDREQAVNDFKQGRLQIISNVDLFGEGLDCPGCEAVILLRPTQSLTLFIQQSMRGMRPDKNNPFKTCIILDHVGNAFRHGLPDQDREWSLEGVKKRKKSEESMVNIRQCFQCYSVHGPADICPYCGYVYPVTVRQLEEQAGELRELTDFEKKTNRMEVGRARTAEEIERIAKERNYKPGWVWYQKKLKGFK